MESILSFLFPYQPLPMRYNLALLALRLLFGGLLMWHGVSKILTLDGDPSSFPNPIGLGSRMSLYLAIFAEVICSAAVIVGAFYRLALIPLVFTMCVAMVMVHNGQSFAAKELALIFLVIYILLFLMGAGRYSLDNMISVQLHEADNCTDMNHNCSTEHIAESATPRQQGSELPTDDAPRQ
ncbi:MAG: DoxX family protein [Alistipes sp.]|nr:DoxX family protein [Alistipes sp.]